MLIGRQAERAWLDRGFQLSPFIFITGIRGIGKTKLVLEWLRAGSKKYLWYTFDRFNGLENVFGKTFKSPEQALIKSAPKWKQVDVVIWDDLHLLPQKSRKILLSFLKSSPQLSPQILISDEEWSGDTDFHIPSLKLAPLSPEEFREYVRTFSPERSGGDLTEPLKITGGIPFLVNLWLHTGDTHADFLKDVIQALPNEAKSLLEAASILRRPFTGAELSAILGSSVKETESEIETLKRKHFLEVLPPSSAQPEDRFGITPFFGSLIHRSMKSENRELIEKKVLRFLEKDDRSHPLQLLTAAIQTGEEKAIAKWLKIVPPEAFESLARPDVEETVVLLRQSLATGKLDTSARDKLMLLTMRALFVAGKREEALDLCKEAIKQRRKESQLHAETQTLILEYLRLLNRMSRFQEAEKTFEQFIGLLENPVKTLALIENGVSYLGIDPSQAKKKLGEVFSKITGTSEIMVLARANAAFQLGRTHFLDGEMSAADRLLMIAEEGFESLEQRYSGAVVKLNRTWVALRNKNWGQLDQMLKEMRTECERFGYDYLLGGLDLIEAKKFRLFLQGGQSLQSVERSIKHLGSTSPPIAILDAKTEKIRVLLFLGLRNEAINRFQELREFVLENRNSQFERRLEALEIELDSMMLTTKQWLKKWGKSVEAQLADKNRSDDDDFILRYLVRTQSEEVPSEFLKTIELYPLGRLAIHEAQLKAALENNETDVAWKAASDLDRLLGTISEPIEERIALYLVQTSLSKAESERSYHLDRAELELKRLGKDEQVKFPLDAWFSALKDRQGLPSERDAWKKATPADAERWGGWWKDLFAHSEDKFIVITREGRREVDQLSDVPRDNLLFLRDDLGDVSYQNKSVTEFQRRHALRKLLAVLLEQSPGALGKEELVTKVWGEIYHPHVHDPRIYTSVQRVRTLIGKAECIETWESGYRWNPKLSFTLVRRTRASPQNQAEGNQRLLTLITEFLTEISSSGQAWVSRSDLVTRTGASEASVKRALTVLLDDGRVIKKGAGRSTSYARAE